MDLLKKRSTIRVQMLKSHGLIRRFFGTASTRYAGRGLLLAVRKDGDKTTQPELTGAAKAFDTKTNGRLSELLKTYDWQELPALIKVQEVFFTDWTSLNENSESLENIDEEKENIRTGIAGGVKQLKSLELSTIEVDPCWDAKAAAEGAYLANYDFNDLKSDQEKKCKVELLLTHFMKDDQLISKDWGFGSILAESQNFARRLMDSPSNLMTPTIFASTVEKTMAGFKNITITSYDKEWAEENNMRAFLGVSQGSCEPPVFLVVDYRGNQSTEKHALAIVGKGVTFDSGGISIKPAANMDMMKADMGGAAVTIGTLYAASKLNLPLNIIGVIPLCENMPSGSAVKPGDVLTAMSGKTIQVDNTDAEGRLILADALHFVHQFNPETLIDIATLTGAMAVATGAGAAGVFTNSKKLWQELYECSWKSGDRLWQMPLYDLYSKQIKSNVADIRNIGKAGGIGGACTAAAFLKEFVSNSRWAHLDIAGVMSSEGDYPAYLRNGMTGRPTRTLVEFARLLSSS
ncbi:Cytosol aminopeptidase [Trichoplax sp. H2]|nr:Cytosol aminopeptidase [Trichoplax sp. H2]|eukprot:RDD45562.1 Cytosol aminopeptidase [Trichoplax sp. H2]